MAHEFWILRRKYLKRSEPQFILTAQDDLDHYEIEVYDFVMASVFGNLGLKVGEKRRYRLEEVKHKPRRARRKGANA